MTIANIRHRTEKAVNRVPTSGQFELKTAHFTGDSPTLNVVYAVSGDDPLSYSFGIKGSFLGVKETGV